MQAQKLETSNLNLAKNYSKLLLWLKLLMRSWPWEQWLSHRAAPIPVNFPVSLCLPHFALDSIALKMFISDMFFANCRFAYFFRILLENYFWAVQGTRYKWSGRSLRRSFGLSEWSLLTIWSFDQQRTSTKTWDLEKAKQIINSIFIF